MSDVKKIYVTGLGGSAKSTLMRLFDGHPQILSTQCHEKFIDIFTDGKSELERMLFKLENLRGIASDYYFQLRWKNKAYRMKLANLKRLLADYTHYYLIEEEAINQKMFDSRSSQDWSFLSFDLDFTAFERSWRDRLFRSAEKEKTPEEVIDALYLSFFENWKDYPVKYSPGKYIAFAQQARQQTFDFLLSNDFNIKIIFSDRDPRGILATHIMRVQPAEKSSIHKFKIDKGPIYERIRNLINLRRWVYEYAEKNPQKLMIVKAEDFIVRTKETMPKIMEFLELDMDERVLVPSHLGQELQGDYLGQINDRWEDVLTKEDLGMIEYLSGDKSFYRFCSENRWASIQTVLYMATKAVNGNMRSAFKNTFERQRN